MAVHSGSTNAITMASKMIRKSEVIIVEAGRGYGRNFSFRMEELGYSVNELQTNTTITDVEKFKGKILQFRRRS